MIKTVSQLISPKYLFKKITQTYQLQNRSLILEHLDKSWENMYKTTMQLLATYRKMQFRIGQKFLFLVTKKERKNKKIPSKWTLLASLVFSLLHSISTCPTFPNNLL